MGQTALGESPEAAAVDSVTLLSESPVSSSVKWDNDTNLAGDREDQTSDRHGRCSTRWLLK